MKFLDIFETRVIIDGQEAVNKLGKLEAQAKDFRAALKDMKKESDEFKTLSAAVAALDKEIQKTTNQIEKNKIALELNGNQLTAAKQKLQDLTAAEQKDEAQIKQTNKEIAALTYQYEKLENQTKVLTTLNEKNNNTLQETKKQLKDTAQYTKEYTDTTAKLKQTEQDITAVRQAYGLNGLTMRQLRTLQNELNNEIQNVTYGTQAYNELKAKIQETSQVIRTQQNDLRDTRTSWQKFKDEMRDFGTATMGNIGGEIAMRAFDGMTQALVGTVTQAAKLSDELADIQRFTGNTAEETKKLNSELSALNTRTSTSDLRNITMVGGQLGVEKEEILGFVKAIDTANVALSKEFGGNAEEVANSLGKLKNIFAETKNMKWEEAISRISSAIIAAGASSSASAPEIADFTKRIGAIGELGPKLTESLGLGAALIDLGLTSEIASSGLQALFITAGKEAESFAAQMGIPIEKFRQLQNENPNEMLRLLALSFKGLDNDEVMAGLQRMGITSGETVKVMALLKDNTDKVAASQALMKTEFEANTKAQDAFNLKMTTFGAQIDLAKKEINGLVAGISSALLPAMTKLIEGFVAFVIILKALPKFLSDNKVEIGALVVALVGLNWNLVAAQANLLRTNLSFIAYNATLRAYAISTGFATAAQAALNIALTANPIGLVIAAIALLVAGFVHLYNNSETVRNVVDSLWASLKLGWQYIKILYNEIAALDFAKYFTDLKQKFADLQTTLVGFGESLRNFTTETSTSFENIANTIKNQLNLALNYLIEANNKIETEWQNFIAPVKNAVAEVGEGFRQYGQMYVDFGKQLANSSFAEIVQQSLTEVGKGFVAYKDLFVSAYNDIVTYDYSQYTTKVKENFNSLLATIQKNLAEVGEGFRRYGQLYIDFGKQILNSSFSENIQKALDEVRRGFVAYAKIFTDFYKQVTDQYLALENQAITYLLGIFQKLKESTKAFIETNFGTDIQRITTAWEGVKTAVYSVKTAFDNLKTSIENTFAAISDNAVSRAINKINTLVTTSSQKLDKQVAADARPSLLVSNEYLEKKSRRFSLSNLSEQPSQKSQKPKEETEKQDSKEDAALIAANKKRAAELAAKNDKTDREALAKKQEERLKAEKEAAQALAKLRAELQKDEEQKEIAQAQAQAENNLAKHKENLAKKLISKEQFAELEKVQQEVLQKELFEIDNKWRAKTAQEVLDANKKTFDQKLKDLEQNKKLDDAQAGLNDINAQADAATKFADNPKQQDEALAELALQQKQAALDRESEFLNQKLALYQENGMLTTEIEQNILLAQTDITAQKIDLENQLARVKEKNANEEEQRRELEKKKIKDGLKQISSAAGSVANSLQQLGIENSAFGKALALTQIAIDTGLALSSSIPMAIQAASATGPAAPFVFAGLLATITATILSSVAQAKSVINAAPPPQKSAAAGNENSGGDSGYFDGGYTKIGNPYEVAGVVHKNEYVIPAHLLRLPQIANFAAITESIRTGKTSHSPQTPKGGFFDGGFTSAGAAPPLGGGGLSAGLQPIDNQQNTINQHFLNLLTGLTSKVENLQKTINTPIVAAVVARDITEVQKNETELDNEIRG